MVDVVTLQEAKDWLRFIHDDEDSTITMLIGAATEAVLEKADTWDGEGPVPDRLKLAVLARVAVAFDSRDSVEGGNGEDRLVMPFRTISL